MSCVVCLTDDGGGLHACSCNTRIHAQCLAGMLAHGYERCRVCLQPFTPVSLLAARRSELSRPEIFGPLIDFCNTATTAGREADSLAMLATLPADCLGEVDLAQFLFERGRCLVIRKSYTAAENDFEHALRLLRRHPESPLRPLVWTLTSLASARIEQAKLDLAAVSLHEGVVLIRKLPSATAEGLMRVVARYYLARGDTRQHAKAMRAIHHLVQAGCPCPVGQAAAYLEMRLAETAVCEETSGVDADGSLATSLKTLRRSRSHPELVSVASQLLGSWCPPRKRCRGKTHPEEATA